MRSSDTTCISSSEENCPSSSISKSIGVEADVASGVNHAALTPLTDGGINGVVEKIITRVGAKVLTSRTSSPSAVAIMTKSLDVSRFFKSGSHCWPAMR